MKTLLPILALASAVIMATPAFAADFSSDFVTNKITQQWELDTLEINQRIDIKKQREMRQQVPELTDKEAKAFEDTFKKLLQQRGPAIDEAMLKGIMGNASGLQMEDIEMITVEEVDGDMMPGHTEMMLAGTPTLTADEAFILQPDGTIAYPKGKNEQAPQQTADNKQTPTIPTAKWSFDEKKQQLMMTHTQDKLDVSASYKLVELTDQRLVLEEKQKDGSVRMIFSSKQ